MCCSIQGTGEELCLRPRELPHGVLLFGSTVTMSALKPTAAKTARPECRKAHRSRRSVQSAGNSFAFQVAISWLIGSMNTTRSA